MRHRRHLHVVAALITRGGRVLLDRRHEGNHAGAWEFPGGKREPGESDRQALRRELWEELGVDATVGEEVARAEDGGADVDITLVLYEVRIHGEPHAVDVEAIAWFEPEALRGLTMPPADQPLLEAVLERLEGS